MEKISQFYDDETKYLDENDILTELELQNVSLEIKSTEWKRLGRCLGLNESVLDAIKFNNRQEGLQEICFQVLLTWQQTFSPSATRKQLANALRNIERNDLSQFVWLSKKKEQVKADISQETNTTIIEELQRYMCTIYSCLELPRVSWLRDRKLPLEELYVDTIMHRMDKYGMEIIERDLKIEDIFTDIQGKNPKRILMEGDPGYGKTTLACKLASDWANEKPYLRQRYLFVFIIILRYFENSLEEAILEQIDNEELSASDILKAIKSSEEKILLILDGFDEVNELTKKALYPVLNGSKFPSMTVLVTSRTGEILIEDLNVYKEKKHKNALFLIGAHNATSSSVSLWDKRIRITGISEDNRKTFLRLYLGKDVKTLEEDRLVNDNVKHLYQCPIFLLLLAILIDDKEIDRIENRTQLFINMINFLIKRNLQRESLIEDEEFDIFVYNKEEPPFYVTFGKLALQKLKQNMLSFNEEEVIKSCENSKIKASCLGILTKNITFGNRKMKKSYECIHKSFLEFLAAFYVSNFLFNESKPNEFKELILPFMMDEYNLKHYTFFLSFVIGLLKDKAYAFFEMLTPYAVFFPVTGEFFNNIFLEFQQTKENLRSLISFIPPLWKINENEFFSSPLHSLLLQMANDKALVNNFIWNLKYKANIPHSLYVNVLHLRLNEVLFDARKYISSLKLRCSRVTFHITLAIYNWEAIVEIVNNIEYEKLNFVIRILNNDHTLTLFKDEFIKGKWQNKAIHHVMFEVYPQATIDVIELLMILLERRKIGEKIVLSFVEFPNWIQALKMKALLDRFLQTAGNSSCLEKFIFYISKNNSKIKADFSLLLCQVPKNWKFLYVDLNVDWNNIQENPNIESIMVDERRSERIDHDAHVLARCPKIQKIMVTSDLLFHLVNIVSHDWKGFNEVTLIEITITELFKTSHFQNLLKFKNLKTLNLMLMHRLLNDVDINLIASTLIDLSLNLFYVTVNENNLILLNSLLSTLKEKCMQRVSNICPKHKGCEHKMTYVIENLKISFFFSNKFIKEKTLLFETLVVVKELLDEKLIKQFHSNSSSNLAEEQIFYNNKLLKDFHFVNEVEVKLENGNYCKYFDVHELQPISVTYPAAKKLSTIC